MAGIHQVSLFTSRIKCLIFIETFL